MENKPLITCCGDQQLFARLHPVITQGLPRDPVEWRRSYGRPPRTIHVEATFVPFKASAVMEDWMLLGKPFFHVYWTDCDIDTYKSVVRDDIGQWLAALKNKNISDWLIVVVVNEENKVKTKLLRTSVFDKVKNEFCGKQTERCMVLTEPFKTDFKSAEQWSNLFVRLRQLLLQAYNRSLSRFEDYMRTQRERRTESGWSFCQYFMLQEELAFMFEMLGLFEDALIQYDELDALFTQFVLNHSAGAPAEWLMAFQEKECTNWDGIYLCQPINLEKRELIKSGKACLLDLRNYLFSRQCTLLFLLFRPWEVAQRSIPFIHNCLQELHMLKIELPEGAIDCWVFLSCLEVLHTCERFNDSGQMQTYSLHTANLWDYARKKLYRVALICGLLPEIRTAEDSTVIASLLEGCRYSVVEKRGKSRIQMHGLGVLCGLMPGMEPTSEQLSVVVELITGLTRTEGDCEPLNKLKEALSSKEAFRKHYMELSELAMGTYKHIGRIRTARLIGKDLASFYMKMGEPQKAEGFLMDAFKTYNREKWHILADNTRVEVAECQKLLDNNHKYVKSCIHIAASRVLESATRCHYQEEMIGLAQQITGPPLLVPASLLFIPLEILPEKETFIIHQECVMSLEINCNTVNPLSCDKIALSVFPTIVDPVYDPLSEDNNGSENSHDATTGQSSLGKTQQLHFDAYFDMKPDKKTVDSCGIICKTPLHRVESGSNTLHDSDVEKEDFTTIFSQSDLTLNPGKNQLQLKGQLDKTGRFDIGQLSVRVRGLEFLSVLSDHPSSFRVACDKPSVTLSSPAGVLYAGIPQDLLLSLASGSYSIPEGTTLRLMPSDGLSLEADDLQDSIIQLPSLAEYQTFHIKLKAYVTMNPNAPEHGKAQVLISSETLNLESVKHSLTFHQLLNINHKLHTAGRRKFCQILVDGRSGLQFQLGSHSMEVDSRDVELISLNKRNHLLVVNAEQSGSYMWQLTNNIAETPVLHCKFNVSYQLQGKDGESLDEWRTCIYDLSITEYKTLYSMTLTVQPAEEHTTCQVGSQCKLTLTVDCLDTTLAQPVQLRYEVLSDSENWAPSGKTTGVFTIEGGGRYESEMEVMPLVAGRLTLPAARLVKYKSPDVTHNGPGEPAKSPERETGNTLGKLTAFNAGQVYNSSLASQIHVLPGPNTSHTEITLAA